MNAKIRTGTPDDASALKSLDTVVPIDPARADFIDQWLREDTVIVAELDGRLVGHGVFNQGFFHLGQVEMLMFHPDYRGKRIGEQLLNALEQAYDTDKLFVTTNLSNQRMQRLLHRKGYAACGHIDELDPGDPELVFVKKPQNIQLQAGHPENIRVIKGSKQHVDCCLAIARELPQYFTEQGIAAINRDLHAHRLYAALDADQVIGFVTIQSKSSQVAEISWMAARPERQHQGIGTLLIRHIVADLKAEGTRLLEVKTVAPDVDYAPYEKTRRFYESVGFVHLETIDPYPGWEPGNPCAIYVMWLGCE